MLGCPRMDCDLVRIAKFYIERCDLDGYVAHVKRCLMSSGYGRPNVADVLELADAVEAFDTFDADADGWLDKRGLPRTGDQVVNSRSDLISRRDEALATLLRKV